MLDSHAQRVAQLARTALSSRRGGEAELWSFRRGHRGVTLRISGEHESGCLLVYCGDVAKYCGPLRWDVAELDVEIDTAPAGDTVYWLTDRAAGFVLVCGALELEPMRDRYPG